MCPWKPLSPCTATGCGKLIGREGDGSYRGRCAKHARGHERQRYQTEDGRSWYPTARWRKLRKLALTMWPMCVQCRREGFYHKSEVADHVRRHGGDVDKFFDINNLVGLCKSAHVLKSNWERQEGHMNAAKLADFIAYVDTLRAQQEANQ